MSTNTGIEWTDATWNPIRGCSRVSDGCRFCYAEAVAARFSGPGQAYEGLARRRSNGEPQWTGEVRFIEKHLADPLRWKTPRRIFVNSMSDLFHEKLTDEQIDRVFAVMALADQHTFQVLTKRPERMREYFAYPYRGAQIEAACHEFVEPWDGPALAHADGWRPLPNVWLGTSCENQETANQRVPALVEVPAAIRFLSCEPLLGSIDLSSWFETLDRERTGLIDDPLAASLLQSAMYEGRAEAPTLGERLHWVIVGGESGRGARECDLAWVRNIVAQCANDDLACFVKQLGANPVDPWADTGALVMDREPAKPRFRDAKGGDMAEWPDDLRVREFPTAAVTA